MNILGIMSDIALNSKCQNKNRAHWFEDSITALTNYIEAIRSLTNKLNPAVTQRFPPALVHYAHCSLPPTWVQANSEGRTTIKNYNFLWRGHVVWRAVASAWILVSHTGSVHCSRFQLCVCLTCQSSFIQECPKVTEGQMKLYIADGNPHCIKVLAALDLTGVKCDIETVSHEGERRYRSLRRTFCWCSVASRCCWCFLSSRYRVCYFQSD